MSLRPVVKPLWQNRFVFFILALICLSIFRHSLGDFLGTILGIAVSIWALVKIDYLLAKAAAALFLFFTTMHGIIQLGIWADILFVAAVVVALAVFFVRRHQRKRLDQPGGRHRRIDP